MSSKKKFSIQKYPLGPSENRRITILAAVALALVYFSTMNGHFQSIDGMLTFYQARSILYDQTLVFKAPFFWGKAYYTSKYGMGLSLLYLPGLILFFWLEPKVYVSQGIAFDGGLLYLDPVYTLAGAPVHILATTISAYLIARFCLLIGLGHKAAILGLVAYGLASPAFVYARSDFAQPLEALCWIASFYTAIRYIQTREPKALFICGLSIFFAMTTRPLEGTLLFAATSIYFFAESRRKAWLHIRPLGFSIAAGAFLAGIGIVLVNYGRYGAPFITGYEGEGFTGSWGVGLAGLFISPARGILWAFPAVFLVPAGMYYLWHKTYKNPIVLLLIGLPLVLILVMSKWHMWWGGVNWGPRLILPALPLLSVLSVAGMESLRQKYRNLLIGFLLAAGIIWAIPCIVTDLLPIYGSRFAGSEESFHLVAYPPFGGWGQLTRLFGHSMADFGSVDILWLRLARKTHFSSLLVPFVLLSAAFFLFRQIRTSQTTSPSLWSSENNS